MSIEEARYIIELRLGGTEFNAHSYRALCERIANDCPNVLIAWGYDPKTIGDNQLVGMDLIREACKVLNIDSGDVL
jgi:hypothetical protein